jgi:predicted nucleic acid-binding protein
LTVWSGSAAPHIIVRPWADIGIDSVAWVRGDSVVSPDRDIRMVAAQRAKKRPVAAVQHRRRKGAGVQEV